MTGATAPRVPLVVTGGSGFVGRRLLEMLATLGVREVVCLDRQPSRLLRAGAWSESWRGERVDLSAPAASDAIAAAMPRDAVIVHLAAVTGKATPEESRAMNVEGTRRIAGQAHQAGARHLIFASSIAAKFEDQRWYHYASSKREAEALVASSGVPYSIVRPTMVFGAGSAIEKALFGLATGAAPIVLGSGDVRTQPVHVDDIVALLIGLISHGPTGATLEAGGADRLTMRTMLGRIRSAYGLPPRALVPIPLALPRLFLGTVEPVLRPLLPVTAGQLAAFVNHSDAAPNDLVTALMPSPRGLEAMLTKGTAVG